MFGLGDAELACEFSVARMGRRASMRRAHAAVRGSCCAIRSINSMRWRFVSGSMRPSPEVLEQTRANADAFVWSSISSVTSSAPSGWRRWAISRGPDRGLAGQRYLRRRCRACRSPMRRSISRSARISCFSTAIGWMPIFTPLPSSNCVAWRVRSGSSRSLARRPALAVDRTRLRPSPRCRTRRVTANRRLRIPARRQPDDGHTARVISRGRRTLTNPLLLSTKGPMRNLAALLLSALAWPAAVEAQVIAISADRLIAVASGKVVQKKSSSSRS